MKTFMDLAVAREIEDDDLDEAATEAIEAWHKTTTDVGTLHDYLGMTWEEYGLYAGGHALSEILDGRRTELSKRRYWLSPACCEPMKKLKPVVADIDDENTEAAWYLRLSGRERGDVDPAVSCYDYVRPSFCPYCGTRLPVLVKKADPPKPLHICDGDYCSECERRADSCTCWAPWFAWEEVKP